MGPGFTGGVWAGLEEEAEALRLDRLEISSADLSARLSAFLDRCPPGGAVLGYLAYELADVLDQSIGLPPAPHDLPLVSLTAYERVVPIEETQAPSQRGPSLAPIVERPAAPAYEEAVRAVAARIRNGDIFQANISRRLTAWFDGTLSPEEIDGLGRQLFQRMAENQSGAFAAYLPVGSGAILSLSPELFLKVDGRSVVAEPIKGTAPRHDDADRDAEAARALLASEKDRAENIMIADLLRNDLSKVCDDHSIVEEAICALRTLPSVHHLYSRIVGRLRTEVTGIDALLAAFPCGSVTGAPKHRAMQVIASLEGEGRGPYCGAILYQEKGGPLIVSVPIRTGILFPVVGGARLDFRVGGGITLLSDPSAEFEETEDKAYAFDAALP